jgi:hypothetical protein
MEKVNVSQGKTRMGKMVRRRVTLASIVQNRCTESISSMLRRQCRWKEKSDEEAKKEQKTGLIEKGILCRFVGV